MSSTKKIDIRGNYKTALLGCLAGWIMKLIAITLRLKIEDLCGIGIPRNPNLPPSIYVLWHNRFFCAPPAWKSLCGKHRKLVALTSASKDGDVVAHAMAVYGIEAIRGSSSRRAIAALIALKKTLTNGFDICITPDGPRGPRYVIQPGFIKLAQMTGAPIIPTHFQFSSAWRLSSWDRFVIPKPFSKVTVTFAETFQIPRHLDEIGFETLRINLENQLKNGTDDA